MKYSLLFILPPDADPTDLIKQVWYHLGCCVHCTAKRTDRVFVMFPFDPKSDDWAVDVDNIGFEGEWEYFPGKLEISTVLRRYDDLVKEAGRVGHSAG